MAAKSTADNPVLTIDIQRLARIKGISKPYTFLAKHGFSHHTAVQYLAGTVRRPDLRHLLTFCRLFSCSINDLFVLRTGGNALPPTDPLAELVRPAQEADIHLLLSQMPLTEVRKLGNELAAARKKG